MEKVRLNDFFLVSDTQGLQTDYTVVSLQSSGEILGANQGKVILDRKQFSFLMQVIDKGYLNGSKCNVFNVYLSLLQ